MVDFGFGQIKALAKTSYNEMVGGNQVRDAVIDIGIGWLKTFIKEQANFK